MNKHSIEESEEHDSADAEVLAPASAIHTIGAVRLRRATRAYLGALPPAPRTSAIPIVAGH